MEKQLPRNWLGTSEKLESKELRRTEIRPKCRVALHVCKVFFGKQLNVCARVYMCMCLGARLTYHQLITCTHTHTHTRTRTHSTIRLDIVFRNQACWLCQTTNCTRLLNPYWMCQTHTEHARKCRTLYGQMLANVSATTFFRAICCLRWPLVGTVNSPKQITYNKTDDL